MVRLNFDYTNRGSSGVKLGACIAGDMWKKASRKRSKLSTVQANAPPVTTGSPDSPAIDVLTDEFDPGRQPGFSKIEVRIPSKTLTDQGFMLVVDALEHMLVACPDLALTEINISDNGLTIDSLVRLSTVLYIARLDLQVINISSNHLCVCTPHETMGWEFFLESFRHCRALRRLDLSDNSLLGYRAFESLARIYNQERPVDPIVPEASITALGDHLGAPRFGGDAEDEVDSNSGLNGGTILSYRAGLRSLPYMSLRNVGLDDTGALFVAAIVKEHFYPTQLVTVTGDGLSQSHGRHGHGSPATGPVDGIDWSGNDGTLTKDAHALLDTAAKLRMRLMLSDDSSSYLSDEDGFEVISQLGSECCKPKRPTHGEYDDRTVDLADFERASKRIERNILIQHGPHHIQLWSAALRYLCVSRKLALLNPRNPLKRVDPVPNDHPPAPRPVRKQQGPVRTSEANETPTYAATVAFSPVKGSPPVISITEITNCPNKAKTVKTPDCPGGESNGAGAGAEKQNDMDAGTDRRTAVNTFVAWQHEATRSNPGMRSISDDPFNLSLPICIQIVDRVLGKGCAGKLSTRQREKVTEWARWRGSLVIENDWRAKDEASQIWMLLEAVECLAY